MGLTPDSVVSSDHVRLSTLMKGLRLTPTMDGPPPRSTHGLLLTLLLTEHQLEAGYPNEGPSDSLRKAVYASEKRVPTEEG